ncbi:hypothetical protein HK102_006953, partial [Quaeritorhiza haematococci]
YRNIDTEEDSFRVEFHVFDSYHNPLPHVDVAISLVEGKEEEEILYLDDDGIKSFVLAGSQALTVQANFEGVGQIGVVAKNQKLDVALLKFTSDVLPPRTFYVIEPNADVLSHLSEAKNADSKDGRVRDLRAAIGDAGEADMIGAMFERVAENAAVDAGRVEQRQRRRLMKRRNTSQRRSRWITASEVPWIPVHVRYDRETRFLLPHFIHEEYGLVPYQVSMHHHLGGTPLALQKRWELSQAFDTDFSQSMKETTRTTTNAFTEGFRNSIDIIDSGLDWFKGHMMNAGDDVINAFALDSWKVVGDAFVVVIKSAIEKTQKMHKLVVKTVEDAAIVLKAVLKNAFAKIWEILKSWTFILSNIQNNIELNELVFTNMLEVLPVELPKHKDSLNKTFGTVETRLQQLFGVHNDEEFKQREKPEFEFRNQSAIGGNPIAGFLNKALEKLPDLPMPPLFKKIEKLMVTLSVFDVRSLLAELLPYRGFPSLDMSSNKDFKLTDFDQKSLIQELAGKLTNVVHLASTIINAGIDTFGDIVAALKDVLFERINLGWISDIIEKKLLRGKHLSLARMVWIWGSFPAVVSMTALVVPTIPKSRLEEFKQLPPQVFLGIEPPSSSHPPPLTNQERLSTALAVRSTAISTHALRMLTCFLEVQNLDIPAKYKFRAWTNVTHPVEYFYNSVAVFQLLQFTGDVALGIS